MTAAVIGVPMHERADFLPEALESLLSQGFRDVAFVLVDDASTDATPDVATRYAAADPRVSYHRNDRRLGMVGTYVRAFELAGELHPGARYFAWASDHDVWHPRWLGTLVAALERHPQAVVAYPRNFRIDEQGRVTREPWSFETVGVEDRRERFRRAFHGLSAGNMVYGLFRREALERAGVYRPVPGPDRLLLMELSLYGEFVQAPAVLWYRRFSKQVTAARQRAAFFPGRPPLYSYAPWWIVHPWVLAWQLGVHGRGRPLAARYAGFGYAAWYAGLGTSRATRRRFGRMRRGTIQAIARRRR